MRTSGTLWAVGGDVESEPAGTLAAAGLRRTRSQTCTLPSLQRVRAKAWNNRVPARGTSSSCTKYVCGGVSVEALAEQDGAGLDLAGGVAAPSRIRGMAARCSWISRLLPSTCTGRNGIQFSGTAVMTS